MKFIQDIELDNFYLFSDQIVHVIRNKDPKYTTYQGDNPSKYGLNILNRLNIKEGLDLGIETIYPGIWGQKYRIGGKSGRIEYIKRFGANAKPYLPKIKEFRTAEVNTMSFGKNIRNLIFLVEYSLPPW